jgi:hypothetical protein
MKRKTLVSCGWVLKEREREREKKGKKGSRTEAEIR